MNKPLFIVISDPSTREGEAGIVCQLFEAGLSRFHLRKPGWSRDEMRELLAGLHPYHDRVVLHSHHCLSMEYAVGGVHIKVHSSSTSGAPSRSASLHRIEELEDLTMKLDYVFLSPFFPSISKPGYGPSFSHTALRSALCATPHTVVALGGIDRDRMRDAKALGADGVALLGAVWQSPDPVAAFRSLYQEFREVFTQ